MTSEDLLKFGVLEIPKHDLESRFNRYIDEIFPQTLVADSPYRTSRVFYLTDPLRYHLWFREWVQDQINPTLLEIDGKYFDQSEVDKLYQVREVTSSE